MSKKYKYVFFDLDGTISNSYEGIARSLDATFAHFGIKVDKALYRRYIGPPLSDTFRLYFDTPEKVSEVVNWFRLFCLIPILSRAATWLLSLLQLNTFLTEHRDNPFTLS